MRNIFESFDDPTVTTARAPAGRVFHVTVSERIKAADLDGQIMPGHTWALRQRNKPRKLIPDALEQFRSDLHRAILDGMWALSPQSQGLIRVGAGKQGLSNVSANLDALFDLCAQSPTARIRDEADAAVWSWLAVTTNHSNLAEAAKFRCLTDAERTDWYRASMAVVDPIISLAAFASWEGCRLGEDQP